MIKRIVDPGEHDAPTLPHAAPVKLAAYNPSHETALAALLADDELRNSLCAGLAPMSVSALLMTDWTNLSGPDAMLWVVTGHEQAVVGAVRFDHGYLGYFIGRRFWGNGFGRAAVRMAVALIGAETTVRAVIDRNNRPSLRIAEGAGFRFAGLADQLGLGPGLLLYVRRAA